jgi:hypothetical protein
MLIQGEEYWILPLHELQKRDVIVFFDSEELS